MPAGLPRKRDTSNHIRSPRVSAPCAFISAWAVSEGVPKPKDGVPSTSSSPNDFSQRMNVDPADGSTQHSVAGSLRLQVYGSSDPCRVHRRLRCHYWHQASSSLTSHRRVRCDTTYDIRVGNQHPSCVPLSYTRRCAGASKHTSGDAAS